MIKLKRTISILIAAIMLVSVFAIAPITASAASEFECDAFTVLSPLKDAKYPAGTTLNVKIRVKKYTYTYGSNGLPTSSTTNYVCLEYYRDGVPHYHQYSPIEYSKEDIGSVLSIDSFELSVVGNYEVKVKYKNDYVGSYNFSVVKADSSVTVKASTKSIKASDLKKSNKTIKPLTIKNASNVKVTKVKSGTTKKIYKKITVKKKTGAITFNKGKYKKGTYKIKLKIKCDSKTFNKTVKVKIK